MLELLIALVVLNVGLFALVAAFNASSVSINRARNVTSAVAVADKQMEVYRGLTNCAIWLDEYLMPASGSTYQADAPAYNGSASFSPQVPYWNAATAADQQYWVTDGTDGTDSAHSINQPNLASCAYTGQSTADSSMPLMTSTEGSAANLGSRNYVTPVVNSTNCGATTTVGCPVKPVQTVLGPDNQLYTVYTYIVLVQPTSGEWTKQVTITVRDPKDVTRVLARESSVFDPTVG